jgi:uncharacterized protein (TIRG00374 family)
MKLSSKARLILNIIFLIAIIGLLYYVARNVLGEIADALLATPWPIFLIVLIIGLLSFLVEGHGIKYLASNFSNKFQASDGFLTTCYASFFQLATFGAGTVVSEIYFYKTRDIPVSEGSGICALRMVMYKLAIMVIALVCLFRFGWGLQAETTLGVVAVIFGIVVTGLIVAVILLFAISIRMQAVAMSILNKLVRPKKIREKIDELNILIYQLRETVKSIAKDKVQLTKIFAAYIIKMSLWYIVPFFVLVQGHPEISFAKTYAYTAFAVVLAAVIPAPGGIGGFEFVFIVLFKPLVGTADALFAALLYRFATYVLPFLIGMVYAVMLKRRQLKVDIVEMRNQKNSNS